MSRETFHPFSKLPTELRLKIWHLAQPDREIIHATNAKTGVGKLPGPRIYKRRRYLAVPARTVPSLIHACAESRAVALPEYRCGFEPEAGSDEDDLKCRRFIMAMIHPRSRQGESVDLPKREVYWRPEDDVLLIEQDTPARKDLKAACVVLESEAPFGGLQAYGVRHVVLPVEYFRRGDWDPRTCDFTWGVETVYVILERRREDEPEFWEDHLAWFGRWWLKVCKPWRETVGEDAPLEERVPFLPKAVGRFEGEGLASRDLDEARECLMVQEVGAGKSEEDERIHTSRYYQAWS